MTSLIFTLIGKVIRAFISLVTLQIVAFLGFLTILSIGAAGASTHTRSTILINSTDAGIFFDEISFVTLCTTLVGINALKLSIAERDVIIFLSNMSVIPQSAPKYHIDCVSSPKIKLVYT